MYINNHWLLFKNFFICLFQDYIRIDIFRLAIGT